MNEQTKLFIFAGLGFVLWSWSRNAASVPINTTTGATRLPYQGSYFMTPAQAQQQRQALARQQQTQNIGVLGNLLGRAIDKWGPSLPSSVPSVPDTDVSQTPDWSTSTDGINDFGTDW